MKDEKLISALKRRKKHALQSCIARYQNSVALTVEAAAGSLLSREDKEELVADVFIALWQSAEKIDETYPSIKPYLCRIARNKTRNVLRRQGNRCSLSLPLEEALIVMLEERGISYENYKDILL